ncbi:hypothetical protein [Corallococcus sp. CA049B]|uniref:hypothetical protein n=1 Tax=Corallococcus sp. CA049B TaxID=2316730 RepID=UPI0011C3D7A2|nr:hypothetical protein [Corallococcus sp. CA049B]
MSVPVCARVPGARFIAFFPELHGAYGHENKELALDSQHRVYVAIASTCNVHLSDITSDPLRGAICP